MEKQVFNPLDRVLYFKKKCKCLMDYHEKLTEMGYFDAPAGMKHHSNYVGGLFDHSANVTNVIKELTDKLNLTWERPESPVIIGMLHDLCKIDQYRLERDGTYSWDDTPVLKGHGIKSVVYIQRLGLKLTDEEIACITYHMGAYTPKEEWKDYNGAIERYPNVLWVHTADMVASKIMGV